MVHAQVYSAVSRMREDRQLKMTWKGIFLLGLANLVGVVVSADSHLENSHGSFYPIWDRFTGQQSPPVEGDASHRMQQTGKNNPIRKMNKTRIVSNYGRIHYVPHNR